LERATRTLLSLFDNPWRELEFTHVNIKDKMFSAKEDRHLLCWAHKYGYGQWEAVKMAIRRSPDFRFDYYLRSLSTDLIGKRCEQLMKAAEKEVENLVKKFNLESNLPEDEKKEPYGDLSTQIQLPKFKVMKEIQLKQEEEAAEGERTQLEKKVEDIENHMEEIQNRLKYLQKCSKQIEGSSRGRGSHQQSEFPEDLLSDLVNLVAMSGSSGAMTIANEFTSEHGQVCNKKNLCLKIEDIAKKERRKEEGDARPVWHVLPEYVNLLSVKTLKHLRREKDARMNSKKSGTKRKNVDDDDGNYTGESSRGAPGPDGNIVDYPPYDGTEEPRECKKAFTLFCTGTRKEVKKSLDPISRKDKGKVNSILKQRWLELSDEEKGVWRRWQEWDSLRYRRDCVIHEAKQTIKHENSGAIPKKRSNPEMSQAVYSNDNAPKSSFHIPKKKKHPPS